MKDLIGKTMKYVGPDIAGDIAHLINGEIGIVLSHGSDEGHWRVKFREMAYTLPENRLEEWATGDIEERTVLYFPAGDPMKRVARGLQPMSENEYEEIYLDTGGALEELVNRIREGYYETPQEVDAANTLLEIMSYGHTLYNDVLIRLF